MIRLLIFGMVSLGACVWSTAGQTGSTQHLSFIQQTGHQLDVTTAAFSPDQRFLLTGSADGSAILWQIAKGLQLRRFSETGSIKSVAFSPDGRYVAIVGSETRVWDIFTGKEIASIKSVVLASVVRFAPNGDTLFVGGIGAELYDVTPVRLLWRQDYKVTAAAFSSRARLVLATDNGIALIESSTGRALRVIKHDGVIRSIALSADGRKLLVSGSPATLIDTLSGTAQRKFDSTGAVDSVSITPDGKSVLLAGKRIDLWDTSESEEAPQ
jgi:WD40 repeat protein